MRLIRRDLLRALLASPPIGWLKTWIPPTTGVARSREPDAAAIYRTAFAWAEALRTEDTELLRAVVTVPLDDRRISKLIRDAGQVLESIREAAAIGGCNWGVDPVTEDHINEGHLNPANVNLVRVACLSARRNAARGRVREALDDLFAGLVLAHRVGTGGVFIARVLECGGEVPAFQTLGRLLPALDPSTLNVLSRRLDALPPPEPASAAIGPESRFILGSIRAGLTAAGPVIEGAGWGELGFDETESATLERLTGGDRARLLAHLELTRPAFAELARRLDLPRPGCRAALDQFAEAERSTRPIAAGLVESAWGVRHVVDRMRALRSMLRAGLALVTGGEPTFRTVTDPFGNGPFALERRGKGYLIRSAMDDEAKPKVELAVGDPA